MYVCNKKNTFWTPILETYFRFFYQHMTPSIEDISILCIQRWLSVVQYYGKLNRWCDFIPVITHSCCISSSLSGVLGITNSSFSSPEASWDTSCLSMLLSSCRGAEGFSGVLGIVKLSLVSKLSLPLFTTLNGLRSLSPGTKLYV